MDKTWTTSPPISGELLGISIGNPLLPREPSPPYSYKIFAHSPDHGDELDLDSGPPSPSPPFRVPLRGHFEKQIPATVANSSLIPSLIPYGPPPGLERRNTRSTAKNPVQNFQIEKIHGEPHVETSMHSSKNHEAPISALPGNFKDLEPTAIKEHVHTPGSTNKHLPGTRKDQVIYTVLLPSPKPTSERKSCGKA